MVLAYVIEPLKTLVEKNINLVSLLVEKAIRSFRKLRKLILIFQKTFSEVNAFNYQIRINFYEIFFLCRMFYGFFFSSPSWIMTSDGKS